MSKEMLKNMILKIVSNFLGFLIVFVVVEVILRNLDLVEEAYRQKVEYDSRVGHYFKDTDWYSILNQEVPPEEFTFRGKNIKWEKAEGVKRYLFIGDSGTWGSGVQGEETFANLFQEWHRGKKNIESINAGAVGFTTVNEYQLLKYHLLSLKPDVVVLSIFLGNDINFNLFHHEELLERNFVLRLVSQLRSASAVINFAYLRWLALQPKKSHSFVGDEDTEKTWLPGIMNEHGLQMLSYFEGEISIYLKKQDSVVDAAFERTKDVLHRLDQLAKTQGFELLVNIIPTCPAVTNQLIMLAEDGDLEQRIAQYGLKKEDLDYRKPIRRLLKICNKINISCLDSTEKFEDLGTAAFVEKDDHLSVEGHRVMTRSLLNYFNNKNK